MAVLLNNNIQWVDKNDAFQYMWEVKEEWSWKAAKDTRRKSIVVAKKMQYRISSTRLASCLAYHDSSHILLLSLSFSLAFRSSYSLKVHFILPLLYSVRLPLQIKSYRRTHCKWRWLDAIPTRLLELQFYFLIRSKRVCLDVFEMQCYAALHIGFRFCMCVCARVGLTRKEVLLWEYILNVYRVWVCR